MTDPKREVRRILELSGQAAQLSEFEKADIEVLRVFGALVKDREFEQHAALRGKVEALLAGKLESRKREEQRLRRAVLFVALATLLATIVFGVLALLR